MSQQRIEQRFTELRHSGRKAFIPYVSAGDPNPQETVAILHALVEGGADVLEVGIPFSDPAADGETIQQANERALARGVRFVDVVSMIQTFRLQDEKTPVVVMGYLNSFERRGFANAAQALADAGVDAVILVDCPVEALPDYQAALDDAGLLPILLVAPTTTADRRTKIIRHAHGFIYCVSLRGVTGKQRAVVGEISDVVAQLHAETDIPVCIGFGIRDTETARAMASVADGIVVGSALVAVLHNAAEQGKHLSATAQDFAIQMRSAIDECTSGQL